MHNVAIMGDNFYKWGGGIDFISLVLKALNDERSSVKVFLPKQQRPTPGNLLINTWNIVKYDFPRVLLDPVGIKNGAFSNTYQKDIDRKEFIDMIAQSSLRPDVREYINTSHLVRSLKAENFDVCFPAFSCLGKNFPVPWIGYVFDMQFKYLPQNFTASSRQFRDREFHRMMHNSWYLIVASRAVRDDLHKFYPGSDVHIFCLPFSPAKPSFDPSGDPAALLQKYGVKNRYMMISNQFWAHKNHITAFKAFKELMDDGIDELELVCTGSTDDGGSSNNFVNIMAFLKENGLEGSVKILGRIPKQDQLRLMYNSLALIQPTIFEGGPGGGAVFDAVTYGVPVLLSDIPVNREVQAEGIEFFSPDDHCQLANLMKSMSSSQPKFVPYQNLMRQGIHREQVLCRFFNEMLDKVIDEYPAP